MKTLLITTGDIDGVGMEVTAKSLLANPNSKYSGLRIIYFQSQKSESFWTNKLIKRFSPVVVDNLELAIAIEAPFVVVLNEESPALWVKQAAAACFAEPTHFLLVTAPLSKTEIHRAGFSEIGHTEILKKVCGVKKNVFMGFIGAKFSVLLATGHIPLNRVESALTQETLSAAAKAAYSLRSYLPKKQQGLPIAVLGLNPHAGDSGIIGNFEKKYLRKWSAAAGLRGPLPADSAFQQEKFSYSVFVACYHDQGLIPFKTVHGQRGVHLSLGLPIRRVSVDHGTAKDIYGMKKADPSSMKLALNTAIDMFKN